MRKFAAKLIKMRNQTRQPVVAINTRHWIPGQMEGVGRFEMNMAIELARLRPDVTFHWLFDRKPPADMPHFENVCAHHLFPPARHPWLIRWWYQHAVSSFLRKSKADVFVSADNITITKKTNCKRVTVLHDVYFEHKPEEFPTKYLKFYRKNTPVFITVSDEIITVSEFSKRDIISLYGVDEAKIHVVYNGIMDHFYPLEESEKQRVRNKLTGGRPYFFVLGSIHDRKNTLNTIKAYQLFKKKTGCDFPILISGRPLWKEQTAFLHETGKDNDVVFTGYVDDVELGQITASAYALLFFSKFEGFGVPVVEAFRCGVPVLTSCISSLPEIAGDAALFANPESIESMASVIEKLWLDEALYLSLKNKGFERASFFSWSHSAKKMWEIIDRHI